MLSNEIVEELKISIFFCFVLIFDIKIMWYKDGKVVIGSYFVVLVSGSLLILCVYCEDKGWYVCNVMNKVGIKLVCVYLKVL